MSVDATGAAGTVPGALLTLGPITQYLAAAGYTEWRKEGLMIENWPVQFLPVADTLDNEALDRAEVVSLDMGDGAVQTRVLRAEHLAAIALRTSRPKDMLRVWQLLEAESFKKEKLLELINRHDLTAKWRRFCDLHDLDDGSTSK